MTTPLHIAGAAGELGDEEVKNSHLTSDAVVCAATAQRWIAVSERLPAYFQPVALIHERTWLNTGDDDRDINKIDAGYRQEFGDCWATAGSHRAMTLDAFTHWMPLPPPPGSQAGTDRLTPNEKEPPDFCDTHCTWMDHHPDCERAAPTPPVDAQWVLKAMLLADDYADEQEAGAIDRTVHPGDSYKNKVPAMEAAREALRTHLNTALSGEPK